MAKKPSIRVIIHASRFRLQSYFEVLGYKESLSLESETYPADCRKIAAVDSNKHDWD